MKPVQKRETTMTKSVLNTLKRRNVSVASESTQLLKCNHCGTKWRLEYKDNGRLVVRYWCCPRYQCNRKSKAVIANQKILGFVIEALRQSYAPLAELGLNYHQLEDLVPFKNGLLKVEDGQAVFYFDDWVEFAVVGKIAVALNKHNLDRKFKRITILQSCEVIGLELDDRMTLGET